MRRLLSRDLRVGDSVAIDYKKFGIVDALYRGQVIIRDDPRLFREHQVKRVVWTWHGPLAVDDVVPHGCVASCRFYGKRYHDHEY